MEGAESTGAFGKPQAPANSAGDPSGSVEPEPEAAPPTGVVLVEAPKDAGPSKSRQQRIFYGELRMMMYGFGDVATPLQPSVHLMEDIVIQYVVSLVAKCTESAHGRRRERPTANDVKFVVRKDLKKLHRVRYLMELKVQIDKLKSLGLN